MEDGIEEDEEETGPKQTIGKPIKFALNAKEKWTLARPLIFRFMFPLFFVYVFECESTPCLLNHLLSSLTFSFPCLQTRSIR